jgi:hypothetical protein
MVSISPKMANFWITKKMFQFFKKLCVFFCKEFFQTFKKFTQMIPHIFVFIPIYSICGKIV